MLHIRVENYFDYQNDRSCARLLTRDSSPQFHQDYELCLLVPIPCDVLPGTFSLFGDVALDVRQQAAELLGVGDADQLQQHF